MRSIIRQLATRLKLFLIYDVLVYLQRKGVGVCALLGLLAACADASDLTPGNVLVSVDSASTKLIREYTREGVFVQEFSPEHPGGYAGTEHVRDFTVPDLKTIHVYNGTFDTYLSSYNIQANTWSHRSSPGWNTINGVCYGGIGQLGSSIYVTDMNAGPEEGGTPNGIVRFDLGSGTSTRYLDGTNYMDLSIGANGLIYAVPEPDGITVDFAQVQVIDPVSMQIVSLIAAPPNEMFIWMAAPAADGSIYTADTYTLNHVSATGQLLGSVALPNSSYVNDLDVAQDGTVIVTEGSGRVILTDANLGNLRTWSIPDPFLNGSFGAFVPVPEPLSLAALALGASALLARRKRSKG